MIFSIRDLSFELGSLLLEGWLALAARAVCALLILLAAWLVRHWLNKKGIPALLARSWYFTGTPILLRSFSTPILRMCSVIGVYLAAASLPWAISGIPKLLLLCFRLAMTLLVCEGLYAASDLADLLLASCSPEIRSNKTLRSLLDTTYKVLVIVLCVAALAQEVGFPIGSIVAGAGLVGLTISLAAQESASNLFSGIVILLDKPFSVGDWITVGSVEGEVIDINFRSTRIRSLDKTINIVTNSQICASTVKNAALRTMRPYKFNLGRVVEVGGVLQLMGLLGNGFGPVQITVAQTVDTDAAGKIQILLAFGPDGAQTVAFFQHDGVAVIGVQDVFAVPLDDLFRIHRCTSY